MTELIAVLDDAVTCSGDGGVLLLGPDPGIAPSSKLERIADPGAAAAASLEERRFDLAIVVGVLEFLTADEAGALLARLRDRGARRLLVAVPEHADGEHHCSTWDRDAMLAHGLEAIGNARCEERAVSLFEFDIDRYKRTPDWLNPNGWANPENWGRYRW